MDEVTLTQPTTNPTVSEMLRTILSNQREFAARLEVLEGLANTATSIIDEVRPMLGMFGGMFSGSADSNSPLSLLSALGR